MTKLLDIIFWASLIIWIAFLLIAMIIGIVQIVKWGGIFPLLVPLVYLLIFSGTVALQSLRK